jgi:hypothetical protein
MVLFVNLDDEGKGLGRNAGDGGGYSARLSPLDGHAHGDWRTEFGGALEEGLERGSGGGSRREITMGVRNLAVADGRERLGKGDGVDGRENPNKNTVTEALGCYP